MWHDSVSVKSSNKEKKSVDGNQQAIGCGEWQGRGNKQSRAGIGGASWHDNDVMHLVGGDI